VKTIYALLCLLGFLVPYSYFVPFVLANGLDFRFFISQLFANQISAFFGVDVLVSSLVLWAFIYQDTRKQSIPLWWLCIVANLAVGVSSGLRLFPWLREIKKEKPRSEPLPS
jgi:hypothetical protein